MADWAFLPVSALCYVGNAVFLAPTSSLGFTAATLLVLFTNCIAVEMIAGTSRRKMDATHALAVSAAILPASLGLTAGIALAGEAPLALRAKMHTVVVALQLFVTLCIARNSGPEEGDEEDRRATSPASAAEEGLADGGDLQGTGEASGEGGLHGAKQDQEDEPRGLSPGKGDLAGASRGPRSLSFSLARSRLPTRQIIRRLPPGMRQYLLWLGSSGGPRRGTRRRNGRTVADTPSPTASSTLTGWTVLIRFFLKRSQYG